MTRHLIPCVLFAAFALMLPMSTAAQQSGVLGCSQQTALSMSAGSLAGSYVPVNDAAVTLTTGYIAYKECVLLGILNARKIAATTELSAVNTRLIQTGRNGNPLYVRNTTGENYDARGNAVLAYLKSGIEQELDPAVRDSVMRAVTLGYARSLQGAQRGVGCAYEGDVRQAYTSPPSAFAALSAFVLGGCDTISATNIMQTRLAAVDAAADECWRRQLEWGRGYYPVNLDPRYPCTDIRTPAALVQESNLQAVTSGFRVQELADDIGEMAGALYANLSTQILADSRGLAGLMQGQPTYLERMVTAAQQNLFNTIVNAALQTLQTALATERAYNEIMSAITGLLSRSKDQLKSVEKLCWDSIIAKACTSAPQQPNNTCTATNGGYNLRVATSSYTFANNVIRDKIMPLEGPATQNLNDSNTALALIQQLITSVSNNSSPEAQRAALAAYDRLIAERRLHTQYDVERARTLQQEVTSSLAGDIERAVKAWGEGNFPATDNGWCNFNSVYVIKAWTDRWKSST